MADFRPSALLSHIKGRGGPARTNRFEAIVPIPESILRFRKISETESNSASVPNALGAGATDLSRALALQCEATELPGRTLMTQEAKIYGPVYKIPYQTQYNEISLTFLCTNEFYERRLFETWMSCIMAPDTNNMRFQNTYATTLQVIQYDDSVNSIYRVSMYNAFPTGISPAPVAWADDGFHRLTVQFAYTKYGIDNSGPKPSQQNEQTARREQLGTGPEGP
jgi:hypothetical protein